jgi:pyruvate formate lyase activating enzyme
LYALTYGKAIAAEVDPIEKKPFYHFMPGTQLFSVATVGCNFRCQFCQNWNISQAFGGIQGEDLPPAKIREICAKQKVPGAAYTYTEPTIFMEYALDTAKLLHKDGRFNTFVTNGYMTSAAIREMEGRIDASRIDLKGFHDRVYKELCGDVRLEYVLESIKELHSRMHIELINLIIPGWNDDEDDIRMMSKWVYDLDPRIPVHFIGFYPANFMMDTPATELGILRRAREIALQEGLHYAYTGNRQDEETESTYCPKCKTQVVRRFGFSVLENKVTRDGKCPECGEKLYFVNDIKEYWKKHPRRE